MDVDVRDIVAFAFTASLAQSDISCMKGNMWRIDNSENLV